MAGPLSFTPRLHCRFRHRFDDPEEVFRTLYSAATPLTCLREVLLPADLDSKTVREFASFSGKTLPPIPRQWRETHVLAPARIRVLAEVEGEDLDLRGEIIALETDEEVRSRLERELRKDLDDLGIKRLDPAILRGRRRHLTQAIARALFMWGAAGVVYGSRVDGEPCVALFESRALLVPAGEVRPLTEPDEALLQVCKDYGLSMEPT